MLMVLPSSQKRDEVIYQFIYNLGDHNHLCSKVDWHTFHELLHIFICLLGTISVKGCLTVSLWLTDIL